MKTKIAIFRPDHPTEKRLEVDGYAYGDVWGVHRSVADEKARYSRGSGNWTVTHQPTGLTACKVPTKRDAVEIVNALIDAGALPSGEFGKPPDDVFGVAAVLDGFEWDRAE